MDISREKELLDRCKRGDADAFGEIYDDNIDAIFSYVLKRVSDVTLAEDLTAQAFMKAQKKLKKFRWQGVSITAWLYRIAGNEVNSHLRRRYRRNRFEGHWAEHMEPVDSRTPDSEIEQAEADVEKHGLFLVLSRVIRRLDPLDQSLITLRYFESKSYADIAEVLGKREGTLRMRASRALQKLKKLLAEEDIKDETYRTAIARYLDPGSSGTVFQTEVARPAS